MESRSSIWALGWLLFFTLVVGENGVVANSSNSKRDGSRDCKFPAIFNFGDSHSDTGTTSAAFDSLGAPRGMSFPGLPGRACDGRLIIDFIVVYKLRAQYPDAVITYVDIYSVKHRLIVNAKNYAEDLGLPYLNSPEDTIGSNFTHGANFATGSTMINPDVVYGSTVPFHLDVQVSQFFQLKSHAIAQHEQLRNHRNNPPIQNNLPEPKVFSEALYTIDIGSNDKLDNLSISKNMNQFSNSVQRLLRGGAKYLWIHNIGPASCTPSGHNTCKNEPGCVLDQNGCDIKSSKSIQEFNKQLKDTVYKLRAQYPDAVITYVDIYSAKHRLIVNAKNYGFTNPFKFCCGNEFHTCGAVDFNGNLLVNACNDPQKYISWDGLHYSQAANQIVAKFVVNGSFSDPPVPVAKACHKQY
ncbi:unnamed protein product [Camellia sinensis]